LVNGVAPGSILTEGTKKLFYAADGKFSERVQALLAHIPLGRPGNCAEIADAVLFLAGPGVPTSMEPPSRWMVAGPAGYIRDF
jgi:NAD(P)-dependent dehydrogenase (short-subunit alcohol dehydrogenase family)